MSKNYKLEFNVYKEYEEIQKQNENTEQNIKTCKMAIDKYYKNDLSIEKLINIYDSLNHDEENKEFVKLFTWVLISCLVSMIFDAFVKFLEMDSLMSLVIGVPLCVVLWMIVAYAGYRMTIEKKKSLDEKVFYYMIRSYEINVVKEKIKNDYGIDVE